MEKTEIIIPKGIEFISDWKEYVLPKGHCIVDKGITGCGYTEMCLRNEKNIILCSPRRLLLENKRDQHEADTNILYLENDIKNWEIDKPKLMDRIAEHIFKCRFSNKPVKFMVVYDSVKYLIEYLQKYNELNNFYLIADEFQSIFLDSYFKASVENNFIETIQVCPNIIYLSATPMLDKYLMRLDAFKNLPYYKLDWRQSGYVETIRLQRKRTNSLAEEANKIIESYLNGSFPFIVNEDGSLIQSKEAVMFFNSVTEITRLIKKNNLTPEQCNIICSKSNSEQVKKVEKLGKGFFVGRIPRKDEENKMFTFCTSSCYIGSDFYSKCASTFIFADPNLECLALDISLDLPQIIGRQRDKNNPFKNNVTIFYKTLRTENINNRKEFEDIQEKRKKNTEGILEAFNEITSEENKALILEKINCGIEMLKYSKDFISIDERKGIPVYNKFIELANERAWEVVQEEYQDSINVTKAINDLDTIFTRDYKDEDDIILDEFLNENFYKVTRFAEKMKLFCEFMDQYKDNKYIMTSLLYRIPDPKFKSYYNFLGTAGCRAKKYQEDLILNEIKFELNKDIIFNEICSNFLLGDKLSKKEIKERIGVVYKKLGIKSTAKAIDILNWFEVKEIRIVTVGGKRDHGFEIIALKRQDD